MDQQQVSSGRLTGFLLSAAVAAATAVYLFSTLAYLKLDRQIIFGWSMLLILYAVKRSPYPSQGTRRVVVILIAFFLTFRYLLFRTFDTLFYTGLADFTGMMALYGAEFYGIFVYILGLFVNAAPIKRKQLVADLADPDLPTVDIFIPTYSESEDMVAITATAAAQVDYPKDKLNIYILDDGGTDQKVNDPDPEKARAARERRASLQSMAEFLEIHYLTRCENYHAKAGNVNEAMRATSYGVHDTKDSVECFPPDGFGGGGGDLILVLDCDHVPTRDILKNTVEYFRCDDKLFLVQTPHFFINPDPVERSLQSFEDMPSENEMFYGAVLLGVDSWESTFFCGSAAVLRRELLIRNGGLSGESITEDAETALDLHAKGFRSAYVSKPMVCGLSPDSFADFIIQRNRWAQGMIQIFMLKNPLLKKGLQLKQRLCYLNSCTFWFFGLARVVFFLAPVFYLFFGLRVYNASFMQIVAYTLPHLVGAIMVTDFFYGHVRHPFFSELYEIVMSFFNLPAALNTLINPRAPSFKVTPKDHSKISDFLSPLAAPFYITFFIILAGYPLALFRWFVFPLEHEAIYFTLFWNTFNMIFIFLCLGVVWERRQIRRRHRFPVTEKIVIRVPSPEEGLPPEDYEGILTDLSEDGVAVQLDVPLPLMKGDEVRILAEDGYGIQYNLPADVIRVFIREGRLYLGCSFTADDEWTYRDIVGFVFGDSTRWSNFWMRRRKITNPLKGIGYLFIKGIEGFVVNFSGIFSLINDYFKQCGESLWEISGNCSIKLKDKLRSLLAWVF